MKMLHFSLAAILPVIVFLATSNHTLPAIADDPNECVDDWTPTSIRDIPAIRIDHTAVWTGSEMIVWGGYGSSSPHFLNTGGRYDPGTDIWIDTSTINAPEARSGHTVVWTGSEMIVWGGVVSDGSTRYLNTGGRYNPATDTWTPTSTVNAPSPRVGHTAVWTGSEMIVWGGQDSDRQMNTGVRYDPATNSWTAINRTNAPTARSAHTSVWTGNEMIVWGGADTTGGRYNPSTDTWINTSTINAPQARGAHTAVWSGNEMIIWGGSNDDYFNTGGRYNPSTDSWSATSIANAPSARRLHTAVWTGGEMIVWGGYFYDVGYEYFDTGGRYNPITDSWTAISEVNAPAGRFNHTSVWTGGQMIVWGGQNSLSLNTGGIYCAQSSPPLILEARVRRHGGKRVVALTWSPADGGSINVLRNGAVIETTDDDGTAQDKLGTHTGTFFYQVCETDSGECSNQVKVVIQGTGD